MWSRLAAFKGVQGRTTDFVVAYDGTVMHGLSLIYVVRELPEIEAFKIVQETIDCIKVLIVPSKTYTADVAAEIEAGFKRRLGDRWSKSM